MASKLVFDTEQIETMIKELKELESGKNGIRNTNKALLEELAGLKKDWNTPAGKKFFDSVDTDWTDEVNKFCDTLHSLREMLKQANTKYKALEKEIGALKFG